MRRGARTVLAGVVAGLLSAALFVVDAPHAGAEGLLGYDMSADARGVQVFTVIPDQRIQPELDIPQASTTQQSGTGYALASSAWPGATVANGGTLLGLLVPGFPPEIAALLVDPVRAEARTGQDPPTTTYDVPGMTMRSRADNTSAESEAGAQGLSLLPGAAEKLTTSSSTRATDSAAVATARSVVQNLNVAGVLQIDQVVSTAKATSDGTTGSGEAHTSIAGATVMGQGVTIDEKGLHFGSTNQPLDAALQKVAKQALASAGISVTLGPATKEINGAAAVLSANSLIITVTQQGYSVGFVLGGARAASAASSSDDAVGDLVGGADTGVLGDNSNLDYALTGGPDLTALGGLGDTSGGGRRTPGPAVSLPTTAAAATGKPVSAAALVLGALAALLLAVGMRRLNTAVLADPTAEIACTLPGEDGA
ncbi:MAG TPA: hypothetical protein VHC63_04970 [Acidimicrobiales bacterium]|nr:hypothetical protein [Acidimicrobiales bacterium]